MVDRGNFFASMFVVLAGGLFFAYFLLGYATTQISQVGRRALHPTYAGLN